VLRVRAKKNLFAHQSKARGLDNAEVAKGKKRWGTRQAVASVEPIVGAIAREAIDLVFFVAIVGATKA
jgi:hypothetical protein